MVGTPSGNFDHWWKKKKKETKIGSDNYWVCSYVVLLFFFFAFYQTEILFSFFVVARLKNKFVFCCCVCVRNVRSIIVIRCGCCCVPPLLVSGYKVNNLQLVKLVACCCCCLFIRREKRAWERDSWKGYETRWPVLRVCVWLVDRQGLSHSLSQGPSNVVVVVYWVGPPSPYFLLRINDVTPVFGPVHLVHNLTASRQRGSTSRTHSIFILRDLENLLFLFLKKNLTLIFFCFSNRAGGILGLCERPATGSHHHDGCGACYAILESPSLRFASKLVECEARRKNKIGRKKKNPVGVGGEFSASSASIRWEKK